MTLEILYFMLKILPKTKRLAHKIFYVSCKQDSSKETDNSHVAFVKKWEIIFIETKKLSEQIHIWMLYANITATGLQHALHITSRNCVNSWEKKFKLFCQPHHSHIP